MHTLFLSVPITSLEEALAIRREIEALNASLYELLGGVMQEILQEPATVAVTTKKVDGRKGRRSAATLAKMAASQQARWAKKKGASPAAAKPAVKTGRKKRKMSPEGRARIVAALKARWAKKKAASTPAPAKSAANAPRKKRTMSPEARARIAAAQRARWAKQKAA